MAIIKVKNPAIDLDAAEIPNLPASKITTGAFTDARMPSTVLNSNVDLTNLSATNMTSGTLPDARFPSVLPAVSGANLTNLPGGSGRILQTVSASDTTTRSTTSTSMGSSPTTGLDINITPSSSSSKILVLVNAVGYSDANGGSGYYTIYRDSSDLGNLNRGLAVIVNDAGVNTCVSGVHMKIIDSPNTTSSVNYKVAFRAQGGGTAYLGFNLMKSYIYALEIGA